MNPQPNPPQPKRRSPAIAHAGPAQPVYEAHIILQVWYAIGARQSHRNVRQIRRSRVARRQHSLNWRDYRRASSSEIKPCQTSHTNMDTCNNTPRAEGTPSRATSTQLDQAQKCLPINLPPAIGADMLNKPV